MMHQSGEGLGNGYLYNWWAITHNDFAPSGWGVSHNDDWTTMNTYLGGTLVSGGKQKVTGTDYWDSPNTGASNSSGFTAYGSGYRDYDGSFSIILEVGWFWADNIDYSADNGSTYYLSYNNPSTSYSSEDKNKGHSVRLVKDSTTLSDGETSTMADEDGNVYDTICIGTQEWTVQNWKCTKLNDGTSLTKVTNSTTWANASTGDEYYCAYDNDENNV